MYNYFLFRIEKSITDCKRMLKTTCLNEKSGCIQANILTDSDTIKAVKTLLDVFESCLGLHGKCKLVHNGSEGYVTVTSCSSRLLQSIKLSHPVLSLISSGIQQHLESYRDLGLTV